MKPHLNRFVPIKKLQELYCQIKEIENEIYSYNINHCQKCGDTQPKHNFYPLLSGGSVNGVPITSSLICNRCALADEKYLELFGEPKEQITAK